MDNRWNIYGISIKYLLNIYEISMEYLWYIFGISMVYLWIIYHIRLVTRLRVVRKNTALTRCQEKRITVYGDSLLPASQLVIGDHIHMYILVCI